MRRRGRRSGADAPEETPQDPADARTLDLSEVSAHQLRDRLSAHRDGREEQVVAAAVALRASLDRLRAGIAARRQALVTRSGEMARAAAPVAGGLAAAGVGVTAVVRRSRRRRSVTVPLRVVPPPR